MKKIQLKSILFFVIILIVGVSFYKTMHHSDFKTKSSKYLFLFKDSILNKVDTEVDFSWVADQDILNHYIYYDDLKNKKDYYELNDTSYNNYYIDIWEFKSLIKCNLEDVFINTRSIIGESKFNFQYIIDPDSYRPISIKYFYKIDGMILNFGDNTKVIKELNGLKYKGFYGLCDKISICNKKGEPQIYINFAKSQTPTILLLYKGHNSFYLIMINSSKKLDDNIIKILNLN